MSADAATIGDANKAATAALDIDKIIEKLLEVNSQTTEICIRSLDHTRKALGIIERHDFSMLTIVFECIYCFCC
jgi:hypothetical protein